MRLFQPCGADGERDARLDLQKMGEVFAFKTPLRQRARAEAGSFAEQAEVEQGFHVFRRNGDARDEAVLLQQSVSDTPRDIFLTVHQKRTVRQRPEIAPQ